MLYITLHPENKCIACEIEDFDVGKHDWCFIACHDCHKKCKNVDDHFYYDNCNKPPEKVELRYKLFAYVSDHSGSMCVVLCDTEATQIVGLNAEKVRNLNKEGDDDSYPAVFKKALEKKVLLRISIKSGNISGTKFVYSLCHAEPWCAFHVEENTASIGCSSDVIPLGSLDSVQPGQESVNESKTVTSSKARGRRINSGVLGEVAIDLEEIPLGQLSTTKRARVSIKKEENN
ncbi:hypothetical protein PIB30_070158 [Stylosanthes scabra]|uniref:Replication factor A C-terminal domain-containing protein n=1 Tax=Stylosanthes scabra TaxID=79078 RepID=A0ABU6QNF9_9FABA|nr:hypothetical protein [Stylosanthes scabra]